MVTINCVVNVGGASDKGFTYSRVKGLQMTTTNIAKQGHAWKFKGRHEQDFFIQDFFIVFLKVNSNWQFSN